MADRKKDGAKAEKQREELRQAIAYKVYEFDAHGVEMNQRYTSKAVVADGSKNPGFSDDPELIYQATTYPGARLPHVWVEKGVDKLSSLDLCGKGRFTLITSIGGDAWVEAAKAVSKATGVDIRAVKIGPGCDYEDPYGDWARAREVGDTGCVLVRPDHHVAWRAKKRPADAKAELTKVFEAILGKTRSKASAQEARREEIRQATCLEEGSQMAAKPIYFSEEKSEEAVIARMDPKKVDPRLYEVTKSLVKHLHAFIKEVEPTNAEWMAGIKFLTDTGHMCTDWRQEFILLSDTLGVRCWSRRSTTESRRARPRPPCSAPSISRARPISKTAPTSRSTARASRWWCAAASPIRQGKPIAGALLDVWQANDDGFYECSRRASSPT